MTNSLNYYRRFPRYMELPNSPTFMTKPAAIRKQDLLCLSLYYLQFSRVRNLVFRLRRKPVARILAFHDVPNSQVQCFREKLKIVKSVANVVSLDDIFAGTLSWEKINVAITFDDGFCGWLDNACPILKDFGMHATFFVSSGLIGLRDECGYKYSSNYLPSNRQANGSRFTEESVRKLAEEGFSIGGHTCNHANLEDIRDINTLSIEIQKDKKELERISGATVDYFAYPFGKYKNTYVDLARVLQASGYKAAVTLVPGFITSSINNYYWHRDLARASTPISVFKSRLLGNYDSVMSIRRILQL